MSASRTRLLTAGPGRPQAMSDNSPQAPPDWHGHLLLLYGSEAERVSALVTWIRRGLDNNEKVIYTESGGEPAQRSVPAILLTHGIDVAVATAEGRLSMVPLPEFYPPGGQLTRVERALAEGFRGLRMTAEVAAALTFLSWRAVMDIERGLEALSRTHPVSAMCQYEQAATLGDSLQEVTVSHVGGIRQRQLSTARLDGGLVLAGDLDLSNRQLLTYTLEAATGQSPGPFRLDLSQVEFLGAAGCRALDEGTRKFRENGGRVLLAAPGPAVERILRLAGVDLLKNIELTGGT
jgi:anti-anti-sigma factor